MVTGHITVLSGSTLDGSRTERLAQWCAQECVAHGGTATLFRGADLELPFYHPGVRQGPRASALLNDLVRADGVVLVTPSYHGGLSGLLKNALDYVNELVEAKRPYLDGRAVGCVALAGGEQGATAALNSMRAIVHALRGWPTPLGISVTGGIGSAGEPADERPRQQLRVMLDQVLWFTRQQPQSTAGLLALAVPRS